MKQIHTAFSFASSSGGKLYQTLLYDDGTTSCDCPGWTRRVQPDGSRTCKHTRSVANGTAAQESVGHSYPGLRVLTNHTTQPRISQRAIEQPDLLTPGRRVFDLSTD